MDQAEKRKKTREHNRQLCLKLGITLKELRRRKAEQDADVKQAEIDRKELKRLRQVLYPDRSRLLLTPVPNPLDILCDDELTKTVRDVLLWALFSTRRKYGEFGIVKEYPVVDRTKAGRIFCCRNGMLLPEFVGTPRTFPAVAARFKLSTAAVRTTVYRVGRYLHRVVRSAQRGVVRETLLWVLEHPFANVEHVGEDTEEDKKIRREWAVERAVEMERRVEEKQRSLESQQECEQAVREQAVRRKAEDALAELRRQLKLRRVKAGLPHDFIHVRLFVDKRRELMKVCQVERVGFDGVEVLAAGGRMTVGLALWRTVFSLQDGLRIGPVPTLISFSAVSPWGSYEQWLEVVRRLFSTLGVKARLEVIYREF